MRKNCVFVYADPYSVIGHTPVEYCKEKVSISDEYKVYSNHFSCNYSVKELKKKSS